MTSDAVGGVWTYAVELRDALAGEGVDVVLAAVGPQAPPEDVPYRPGRLEWEDEPWDEVAATGEWLLSLAADAGADVVHLNDYAHGALDWPVPAVVVGHSDVLSWHEAVRGAPAPPSWNRYRDAVRTGLDGADAVVVPTAAMAAALARHYGATASVIPNGVAGVANAPGGSAAPTSRAAGGSAAATSRAASGSSARPFVLAAGRLWDEAKGLATLDEAAGRVAIPVEVAGADGDARNARLLGVLPRDQLRARMAEAAIFAHPARYEPFGLAVLEAALARCALVLGDIPSLRELWDGAALFVAPGDATALASALDRLAHDEALRERLAEEAARRAARHDAACMARAYTSLYTRLHERVPA